MGAHSEPASQELVFKLNLIVFDMNMQISELTQLVVEAEETGNQLLGLHTHNMDVAKAGGGLTNVVRQKAQELITQYRIWIQSVEDYKEML